MADSRDATNADAGDVPAALFGRDADLSSLLLFLGAGQVVGLYGPPGIGKSALASALADRFHADLDRPVIVLRDLGAIDIATLCDIIAVGYADTTVATLDNAEKPGAISALLAGNLPLVILDDLVDADTAAAFVEQARPVDLPVLLVSRDRAVFESAVGVSRSLPALTAQDGLAMLRERSDTPTGDDKALERVVALLDHVPFALTIAAHLILAACDPEDLGRLLVETAEFRDNSTLRGRENFAVLRVACEALARIERQALRQLAACPATSTGVPLLAAICERDEVVCRDVVQLFQRRGLATLRDDRVVLHRLVREFVRQLPDSTGVAVEAAVVRGAITFAWRYADDSPEAQSQITAEADNLVLVAEAAIARHEWAVALDLADTVISVSGALQARGYWRHAVRLGRVGIAAARALSNDSALAGLLHNTASMLQERGEPEVARGLYEEALALAERADNQPARASALHQLGILAHDRGALDEARRLYTASREIDQRLNNREGVARSQHQLSNLAYQQGEIAEARQLYEASLAAKQQSGDMRGLIPTLHQLGMLAQQRGDPAAARQLYKESLAYTREMNDAAAVAKTTHQLGVLAHQHGEIDEARRFYEASLASKISLGDQAGIARSQHQLGILAQSAGDFAEARRLYERSRAIEERLGDQIGVARTLHQLGILAYEQGNIAEARQFYEASLALKVRLGDRAGMGLSLAVLGILERDAGDYAAARERFIAALTHFQRLSSSHVATVQRFLANLPAE